VLCIVAKAGAMDRRHKQARFRDTNKTLDTFDFQFNPKMNRVMSNNSIARRCSN
jgi:hypothetical protein